MLTKKESLFDYLSFPTACTGICATDSGVLCIGTYKPSIKQFCFEQKTQFMERHANTELLKCQYIEEGKFCVIKADRTVDFYNKTGMVDSVKFYSEVTDIGYCDKNAYVATAEGFTTINLMTGEMANTKFMTKNFKFKKELNLLAFTTENSWGIYDTRTQEKTMEHEEKNTKSNVFDVFGNNLMLSTSDCFKEFDIRNPSKPLVVLSKDFSSIIYKNESCKILIDNNNLYENNLKNRTEKESFLVHSTCFYDNYLFIGGETENILVYEIS